MDSKEDFERGSSGMAPAVSLPSDLSEGIIPPPTMPAWAYATDDDANPPPRDIDPETTAPTASAAPDANRASIEVRAIITSTTSYGLADTGAPPTERADVAPADLSGLLLTRAAALLDTAEADAVDAASRRVSRQSLPPAAAGGRGPFDDPPPLTPSARPPPKDDDRTRVAICDERDDGREEEKRDERKDDEAPRPPMMVEAAFEEARPE